MARVSVRVWLVGLLVLGLVVGLLGVAPPGAVGTHGDEEDIDFAPMYSACVGAATDSAGFEDTAGIGARDAIDCLFHYGITTGRSETLYAPGESVLRWQMALFLARAAMAAGIVLENPAGDQGFTDIGGVSEEAQNAINGLAKAGIMPGTAQGVFSPNASVNRGSMAMLLDAFLAQATPGAGAFGDAADSYEDVKADNFNVFNDVSTVSLNTYNAIFRIYELGVTKGVGEHRFNPGGLVTRGQMASFITRAFAHTVARPAGVSIQSEEDMVRVLTDESETVALVVSVRDTNFQPVADAVVDVFSSTDPDNAFGEDGACVSGSVDVVGQGDLCVVDTIDYQTNARGDLDELSVDVEDGDVTVWAWTGDVADKFDSEDTVSAQLVVGFAKAANQTLVSDDLTVGQTTSKFGETVKVTIQVADEDGNAVPEAGKRVTVGQAAGGDGSGSSSGGMSTDADGKIVLELTQADPDANSTGQVVTVTVTLSGAPAGLPLQDEDGEAFTEKVYRWSDEAAKPTSLTLSSGSEYTVASDTGRGANNTVTATLTDQYGDPVPSKTISFLSDTVCRSGDDADECPFGVGSTTLTVGKADGMRTLEGTARSTRSTGRRGGPVDLRYYYKSEDSVIETIWATYTLAANEVTVNGVADTVAVCPASDPPSGCRPADDPADVTVLTTDRVYHYWVEEPSDAPFTGRILVKDPDNDRMVVAAEEKLMLVAYDSNDQFNDFDGPTVMAEFEKPLAESADPAAVHLKVDVYGEEASDVSTLTLQEEWLSLNHPTSAEAGAIAHFGEAVAADNGVIVVGAPYESVTGATVVGCSDRLSTCMETDDTEGTTATVNAGMVYIYPNGIGTASTAIVKIKPPDADIVTNGHFGWDVDIAGNTVVVGTRYHDDPDSSDDGLKKVYIYEAGADGTWAADPDPVTLEPAAGNPYEGFGEGVAISSDGSTIAVVATDLATSGNVGAVVVYEKPNAGAGPWVADNDPSDDAVLVINGGWDNERSVAISGDGATIAASTTGSCGMVRASTACGMYVYQKPSGVWADRTGADTANVGLDMGSARVLKDDSEFGKNLAFSEDGTVLVASQAGNKVRVYVKPTTNPNTDWETLDTAHAMSVEATQGFDLTVAFPRSQDMFGQYVAISPDGSEIAASRHQRQEGHFRGSVVTFQKPAAGWAADSSPDGEFLGPRVNARLGWQTTYDKSDEDGILYSGIREAGTVDGNDDARLMTVYRITR